MPKGYKQTELGIIPEDWTLERFEDICWVNQGLQIAIEKRFKREVSNSKKYITIQYINNSKEVEYIQDYQNSVVCNKEDLLMTRTGNTGFLVTNVSGVFHNNFFKINYNKEKLDRLYLIYFMNKKKFKKLLLEKAGTSTIPDLNHKDFFSLPIFYPLKPEQQAIANVLSNTDELIQALEKLIEKKKNIKEGTMQQLLTGKMRLKEFNEEWEVKKLEEIGDITGAGVDKKINQDEEPVRLLNYLDVYRRDYIYSKELEHWVTTTKNKLIGCSVKKGDLFFTPSSELREDIGISALAMEDMEGVVYSYHIDRFRLNIPFNDLYRLYMLKTRKFLSQCETFCEGSGKRYVISMGKFREMEITYPKSLKEQETIAQILTDMDNEIDTLKQKLNKYKQIKEGMMQQLLTGKIRLM